MTNQMFATIILFTTFVYAQETTTGVACPLQGSLDAEHADYKNSALLSAYSSFEQNSAYSSANAEFSSAYDSFPAYVTSSLYCSGYGGIDINSLPTWLTSVPTSVVSIILKEEQVYESIVSSVEKEMTVTSSASASTPSTLSSSSSQITTSGTSASASSTSFKPLATTSSSSTAAAGISKCLTSCILTSVSLILARLL